MPTRQNVLKANKKLILRKAAQLNDNVVSEDCGIQGADVLDVAFASSTSDLEVASLESNSERIKMINDAVQRIREDMYGICTECDKPIAVPRLEALPETPYCLRCASALENDQDHS